MSSRQKSGYLYTYSANRAGQCLMTMLLIGLAHSAKSFAQAPLDIDALMATRAELKLQMGYSFLAASDNQLVPLQLAGQESTADLPQLQAIVERDIEAGQWVSALRYGVDSNLELRSSILQRDSRTRSPYRPSVTRQSTALTVGGTWQVSADRRTPALLLSLDVDIASSSPLQESEVGYGKSVRVNALTYRTFDPVVLSVQLGYEYSSSWRQGNIEYLPGNNATAKTQISFALNPEVTLIGGLGVQRSEAPKVSGIELYESATQINLTLAGGLALSRRSSLFLGADVYASGLSAASVNVEWLYQFEL
ncbi:MAG: hypothetical protein ABJ056_11550 [Halioglobus sp.]